MLGSYITQSLQTVLKSTENVGNQECRKPIKIHWPDMFPFSLPNVSGDLVVSIDQPLKEITAAIQNLWLKSGEAFNPSSLSFMICSCVLPIYFCAFTETLRKHLRGCVLHPGVVVFLFFCWRGSIPHCQNNNCRASPPKINVLTTNQARQKN